MVYITHIRMVPGGTGHAHISDVKWRNPGDGKVGESTRAAMVDWIDNKAGDAKVTDGKTTVDVVTVANTPHPKYLRTAANGKLADNLLALPRF